MGTSIREAMILQLDEELPRTRRTLERVPDERWDWRPHERSMPMGALAAHVATLPAMVATVLTTEAFDLADRTGRAAVPTVGEAAQLVPTCERLYGEARRALEAAGDEDLAATWSLSAAGRPVAPPAPRHAYLTTLFFHHLVHHRAQLGVYLRLLDIPVPAVYGPSADEPLMP
jgi:uncharacterized damage-inducible protein DinB